MRGWLLWRPNIYSYLMKSSLICLVLYSSLSLTGFSQDSLSFLALGDSYTIGESVSTSERWPVQLRNALNRKGYKVEQPLIIAKTGWRTDELNYAIDTVAPASDYDIVGLLIGVNNQYQGKTPQSYRPEFQQLLDRAIALAGGDRSRVFVVSIPDYGYTPFGEKNRVTISSALDEYNLINRELSEKAGVKYYYITDISRQNDPGLIASDDLHPSGKQYSLWVERILNDPSFYSILKD